MAVTVTTRLAGATDITREALAGTAWVNPNNVLVEDDTFATENITVKNTPATGSTTAGWLVLKNFGIWALMPLNASILKVEIIVRSCMTSTGGVGNRETAWAYSLVRGTNVHTSTTEPTAFETVTYDVTSERAWTRDTFHDSNFEIHVRGRNGNSANDPGYKYAYVQLRVTWDDPVTPPVNEGLIDDFNRADNFVESGAGSSIWSGNNWDNTGGASRVISNQLGITSVVNTRLRYLTSVSDDFDWIVEIPVISGSSSAWMGFAITPGASYNCYEIEWTMNVGLTPKLRKYTGGVQQADPAVIYSAGCSVNAGDTLWVARRGTRVTAYRKPSGSSTWTKYLEAEAPDYIAGYLGLHWVNTAMRWENVRGGGLGPQPPGNITPPAISGELTETYTLSVSTGTWTQSPTGYTYQWRKGGVNIAGATTNTYTSLSADVGSSIDCVVTATNAQGSRSSTSNSVVILAAPVPLDQTVYDNFDRANGSVAAGAGGTLWESVSPNGSSTLPQIVSNQVVQNPSAPRCLSKFQLARNFDIIIDMPVARGGCTFTFCISEGGTSAIDGYTVYFGTSSCYLTKVTNDTETSIGSSFPGITIADGDTFWVAKRGTVLTLYHRPAGRAFRQVATATDATYDRPGPFGFGPGYDPNTVGRLDNLRAGPLYYPPIPIVSVV